MIYCHNSRDNCTGVCSYICSQDQCKGKVAPEYAKFVGMSTSAALKEMILPGPIAIVVSFLRGGLC